MVFSLRDTRPQSEAPPEVEAAPIPLAEELADPLLRAIDWSELYRRDFEYERFYDWLDRRNDPNRPDRMDLLGSIPLHFSPAEIPPPLRRHFVESFNREK